MNKEHPLLNCSRTDRVIIERSSVPNETPVSWNELCQKYSHSGNKSCYMCQHVDLSISEEQHSRMFGLAQMIREQFTQKSLDELANMCCEYMKSEFVPPPPASVTPSLVKEHLLYHIMSPSIRQVQTMRNLTTIERFLRDHLISADSKGSLQPNTKVMNTYLAVQQRLQEVAAVHPTELAYNSRATDVSCQRF